MHVQEHNNKITKPLLHTKGASIISMKQVMSIILFLFGSINGFCQKIFEIRYENFTNEYSPRALSVNILTITDSLSVSYTYPYNFTGAGVKRLKTNDNTIQENLVQDIDTIKRYVYKNFATNSLLFEPRIDFVYKEYKVFKDSLHNMEWYITSEEKMIDSFKCVKATTHWRGRHYIAWFAKDIPIPNGPWKFGGLPGLIIEIFDTDKVSFWRLKTIRSLSEVDMPVMPKYDDGNFLDFRKEFNTKFNKIKRAIEANDGVSNPSCSGCKGSTVFSATTPERLTENN